MNRSTERVSGSTERVSGRHAVTVGHGDHAATDVVLMMPAPHSGPCVAPCYLTAVRHGC